ncbi:MAG: hypothetical protein QOE61_1411 [Micromonosporaceae bacterium]|nr:hypothetical protein [Micromonosporaceae bacterium]
MITLIAVDIDVEEGWAVGDVPLDDPAIDRDLLVDAKGAAWVPGSSLAGSLRAHLSNVDALWHTGLESGLMGGRPPQERGEETDASRLWFLGTSFAAHDGAVDTEVVGQTAIDRHRGAATANTLRYSRSVATAGRITAYLRLDGRLDDQAQQALAAWQPHIGRDRTTGAGRAHLGQLRHGEIDPSTPEGMRTWLTHTGADLIEAVATHTVTPPAPPGPWYSVELSIVDGLLVGDPRPTGPARPRQRNGRSLVPGSAWKGIFRSRVEFILRSLYGPDAVCHTTTGCGACVTCDVFGHQGHRGRLAFADSLVQPTDPTGPAQIRTHVGIDRVTGGARDSLLYQTVPITHGQLTLRIDQLAPVEHWVRNAITHVLRDLHDGLIGVGSRVTRGLGTVRVASEVEPLEPVHVPQLGPHLNSREASDDDQPVG